MERMTRIPIVKTTVRNSLRRSRKPVLLVCNKVDNGDKMYGSYEFNRLGLGEPICISSATGSGTGDLLDEVVKQLPEDSGAEDPEDGRTSTSPAKRP